LADDELQAMLIEAEKGPSPSWPRIVVSLVNKLTATWSISKAARGMLWAWIWLLCWAFMAPSLSWPFANQMEAEYAIIIYAAGALIIPLLIGLLTTTRGNKFWEDQNLDNSLNIRLYTYQGAGIGYHLGYFAVFTLRLLSYYLHLNFTTLFQLLLALLPVAIGYASTRLVPYNLRRAYGRLSLKDGWIFFVFLILGPVWGFFFYHFNSIFLSPSLGALMILLAITIFIVVASLQLYKQKD
jgi:hypothetical protein